jgi:tetratricopeptide (TPR) repeat protein
VEQVKPLDFLSDSKLPASQALALFDRIEGRGISMPRQLRLSRLVLLCAARGSDTEGILAAIDEESKLVPEEKERLPQQVVSLLLAKPSAKDALRLIGALANRTVPVSETFGRQWLLFTAVRGDIDDVKYLVERVSNPGALLRLAAKEDAADVNFGGDEASQRAELAYVIGNFASSEAREDIAEGAYRLTIKARPDHAWALNNLGYYLLERGDAMEEAATMITASYQQLSDQPSVIDSFAWLKYKRGQFEDLRMPDGNSAPGAVTLMEQVVANQTKPLSFEQLDHYGDSLWRVGRKLEAKVQWEAAQRMIDSQLSLAAAARGQAGEASPAEKRLRGLGEGIAAKSRAVAAGQPPAVAATAEERARQADHK